MKIKHFSILLLLIGACSTNNNSTDDYSLLSTGMIKAFNLDNNINYAFYSLFTFVENEKYFINFLNYNTNQLLFYEFENPSVFHQVELEYEGSNGVGKLSGFWANSFNEIYTTSFDKFGISLVDSAGKVKDYIPYPSPEDGGYVIVPSFLSQSFYYQPLFKINSEYYITQRVTFHSPVSVTPVSVKIDSLTHKTTLLPFAYPDFMDNPSMDFAFADYSREFDGKRFIYSFILDENIYITDINHKKVDIIPLKSKYINKINPYEKVPRTRQGDKRNCERPWYHNLVYDKYRDVYYRFVFPETEVSSQLDYPKIISQGRKEFSIIILDKDFNILGETLFPPYEYVSHVFFIHPDGLYICNNHVLNENFNEDVLSFECFELVKK